MYSARSSFAEMLPFQSSLRHRHDGSSESVGSRKPDPKIARHLSWDTLPPGRTQAGHHSFRDLLHIATVLAQTLRCYGSLDRGPGHRIFCRVSTPVPIQSILPVVTDLETPWQNSVVERHGALFKMAFEEACRLEAPTTEAEVNELIDFTSAELNRQVGRAGFRTSFFGRQLRFRQVCSNTITLTPT